jgi:D-arabinose 1-dehydrogenase-like Zn-dependent alcohol dehydrogenase
MRAVEVQQQGGPLVLVERPMPEPGDGQVRIRVHACGVCHSDSITVNGLMPGITYPRVPGHEVIGVIDAVGPHVSGWTTGVRVGVGWNPGHCGHCRQCRRGNAFACENVHGATGVYTDGGYQDYMIADASAVARVPDGLDSVASAPLLCAGLTTFNALRHSGARPGDTVAVLGVGGLGHLAVQFASRMGFRTVAMNRGTDKEAFARELGAHDYVDSAAQDPADALLAMGGAQAIIATATSGAAMQAAVGGLAPTGTFMVIGAVEPFSIDALGLLTKSASVKGWYSGVAADSEDTLAFSALTDVTSMNEVYPLEDAQAAYDRMMSGQARFRVVLDLQG